MDGSLKRNPTEKLPAMLGTEKAEGTRHGGTPLLFVSVYLGLLFAVCFFGIRYFLGGSNLRGLREDDEEKARIERGLEAAQAFNEQNAGVKVIPDKDEEPEVSIPPALMLDNMSELYAQNEDVIGWLRIEDTVIDYPVMQTMEDEEYYLYRDFDKRDSVEGSLILDTDSTSGTGTLKNNYEDGTAPSTNLIIHGHNMKNGAMFGDLDKWRSQDYEKTHNIIEYSSLYEKRKYEIVSVFLSQVYRVNDEVFKYYKFFNANSEEEFNDFYNNIKEMALYDTGVEAHYGDEFITLSVCAYHVENGRLVVVGKRIE